MESHLKPPLGKNRNANGTHLESSFHGNPATRTPKNLTSGKPLTERNATNPHPKEFSKPSERQAISPSSTSFGKMRPDNAKKPHLSGAGSRTLVESDLSWRNRGKHRGDPA